MTGFTIVAVGRMKAGALTDLAQTYCKRITWPLRLIEIDLKTKTDAPSLKADEAAAIRAKLPAGAVLVALDERGKAIDSPAFAAWIGAQQTAGAAQVTFVIGGADGLDESLRREAHLTLAFGQMTWPHMLARVMLLEQVYRAQQILGGHPYHRV